MAYREHGMWEILEVLRRAHAGESLKLISRGTQRSRNTIKRYLKRAKKLGWFPRSEEEPTENLAVRIAAGLRPGPSEKSPESREAQLLPHRDRIKTWLDAKSDGGDGLTLTKAHQKLRREGLAVPYSSLHRFATKHCGFGGPRQTVRMALVSPGEVAEVDFGRMGLIPAGDGSGRKRTLHALIITLVYSRHQYVYLTHSQRLEDLIDGLEEAWEFFGGVPRRVILDNMKAAVIKADRYEPIFQRTFSEYSNHRGFKIDAARKSDPTGKPHVERQVPYVRRNFFQGESFIDRDHVQREARRWCLETAGLRIHGTTCKRPLEEFEAHEKSCLTPITGGRFDTPRWAPDLKVHPDHHIRFGKALYSVPTKYLGRKVTVRGDKSLVRIYHKGELIKTHPVKERGGRSTDYSDYPAEKTAYAMRSPHWMIERAVKKGPSLKIFMERLLAGDFPWARLRQAQKLLRMADKYGAKRVDAACRRALAFDLIDVFRVERILVAAIEDELIPKQNTVCEVLPWSLRFSRHETSFSHHTKENLDGDGNQ